MPILWELLPDPPPDFLEKHPEIHPLAAKLLYHRNITGQAQIDEFLHPDYSTDVHDPFLFKDMDKAVTRIHKAISENESITIHGDYDADGVSGSTILYDGLKVLGHEKVDAYLPHRETDGYGLNLNTIDKLHAQGTNLIITCDCGISNAPEVERANSLGMDVIITDHHAIPDHIPDALAIIHPKAAGETYPDKNLCGAAVAFKLVQALLHTHAKNNESLADGISHEKFEKWLLDLVAIASVADMVPLIGESRTLTTYGLLVLNKTRRPGLHKLLEVAGQLNENGEVVRELDTTSIGFYIAPRINAAGRMNHANTAFKLLISKDNTEVNALALRLNQENEERRELTKSYIEQAHTELAETLAPEAPLIFVTGHGWPTGIIGLISGRLKEHYQKPAIVMSHTQEGEVVGSGRSVTGFSLIEALQSMPELFKKFGGHPMACGFSLASPDLIDELKEKLAAAYFAVTEGKLIESKLIIDAEIQLSDLNWKLFDVLENFKPYGPHNEQPLFLTKNLIIDEIKSVGKEKEHLVLHFHDKAGKKMRAIGWRLCNPEKNKHSLNWGDELNTGDKIDLVCELGINEWNGNRELQYTIVDLKKSELEISDYAIM